jgi:chemotaxis protein CheZ
MSSGIESLRAQYGESIAALAAALEAGDEGLFLAELDTLVQRREQILFGDLRKLTTDLQRALDRFRIDSRLVDLAEHEVPDARVRLTHVLKLTDEAAHKTLDLVERSAPLADRTARAVEDIAGLWKQFRNRSISVEAFHDMLKRMDQFLASSQVDMEQVRNNLNEVLMAQGYQDLSGQIIRGVMKLVSELEVALAELVRLSKMHGTTPTMRGLSDETRRGFGPVIPGVTQGPVVNVQSDVDSLLSGLGM